ncbi:MAG: septation protein SpoVG family protein [Melioribacteraceae bacterium]|nr:septation protein SpoVG family protein [Melioribacteraceae bacterium]
MKIVRMSKLENSNGKTQAYFDIQTSDGIVLKGFRIVSGTNGLFVSAPNEKGKDGKYYDTIVLPKEMKEELQKTALEEFENS